MRSMWKGSISFGLVTIPVKLYTATEQRDVSFRQVHAEDGGRIHFRRVCSVDGEEVPFAGRGQGVRAAGRRDGRADRRGSRPSAAAHGPQHRGAELQPGGPGGSHPVEPQLLRGTRAGRGPGLRAAPGRAGTLGQGRRDQGGAAPARVAGRAAQPRRPAGAGDDAVARRGARPGLPVPGHGHRRPRPGTAHGDLAHRLDDRGLRAGAVPRFVPGGAAGTGRGQGRGPRGDRGAPSLPRRSRPACWTRCRPAWTRPARTARPPPSAGQAAGPAPETGPHQTPHSPQRKPSQLP